MTSREIDEFRAWHASRLIALAYPVELAKELSEARERWIAGVKRR